MRRHDNVPLRDYTDRALADLARYHDATVGAIQAEIDRRLGEVQRETENRFREQATALKAASDALERRLDGMNEFREQVRDITTRKIDADLYQQAIDGLAGRIDAAEAILERQRGRMGAYAAVGTIAIILVGLLTLAVNHIRL